MRELKLKVNQLVSYLMNALSFVMLDSEIFPLINSIYFFGSWVRKEGTKKSDVDLFIACNEKKVKVIEKRVQLGLRRFYSSKDFEKWKLLGINFPISVYVGNLEKWELKESIKSEGILLYSKQFVRGGKRKVLVRINLPKKRKNYLRLIRLLYGRKEYGKEGLVQELQGEKLSTNCFILPKENLTDLLKVLHKHKVSYSLTEFFTYD